MGEATEERGRGEDGAGEREGVDNEWLSELPTFLGLQVFSIVMGIQSLYCFSFDDH